MEPIEFDTLTVLVVDDSPHPFRLLVKILRGFNIRNVIHATDVDKAYSELQNTAIDIAIVDWEMPDKDGIEFVKMVRTAKDSPNPFLPIIMFSGNSELSRVQEARDSGSNEFLAKPVSPKNLFQRINSIVYNPRPFMRTKSYFGPDRRRRQLPFKGPERRKSDARVIERDAIAGDDLDRELNR